MIDIVKADLSLSAHAEAMIQLMDEYALDPMGGGQGLPDYVNLDLAPFRKSLSGNGFKNNFKAMTGSNIGTNLKIPEKFQPKDRRE